MEFPKSLPYQCRTRRHIWRGKDTTERLYVLDYNCIWCLCTLPLSLSVSLFPFLFLVAFSSLSIVHRLVISLIHLSYTGESYDSVGAGRLPRVYLRLRSNRHWQDTHHARLRWQQRRDTCRSAAESASIATAEVQQHWYASDQHFDIDSCITQVEYLYFRDLYGKSQGFARWETRNCERNQIRSMKKRETVACLVLLLFLISHFYHWCLICYIYYLTLTLSLTRSHSSHLQITHLHKHYLNITHTLLTLTPTYTSTLSYSLSGSSRSKRKLCAWIDRDGSFHPVRN